MIVMKNCSDRTSVVSDNSVRLRCSKVSSDSVNSSHSIL